MTNGIIGLYDHPYLVNFRLDKATRTADQYQERYSALAEAIGAVCNGTPWKDGTSCIVMRSGRTIEEIAACLARAIHPSKDVVLVVCLDGPGKPKLIGTAIDEATLMSVLPQTTKL